MFSGGTNNTAQSRLHRTLLPLTGSQGDVVYTNIFHIHRALRHSSLHPQSGGTFHSRRMHPNRFSGFSSMKLFHNIFPHLRTLFRKSSRSRSMLILFKAKTLAILKLSMVCCTCVLPSDQLQRLLLHESPGIDGNTGNIINAPMPAAVFLL